VISLTVALFGVSCSGKSGPNIVGTWQAAQGDKGIDGVITGIQFLQGGTFIFNYMNTSGNYSFPDSTHIKFQSPGGTLTYNFTLSGNLLTITDANGVSTRFQRTSN